MHTIILVQVLWRQITRMMYMCKTLWGKPPLACGHIAISLYMFRYKYIVHLVLIYNGCLWLHVNYKCH